MWKDGDTLAKVFFLGDFDFSLFFDLIFSSFVKLKKLK